MSESRSESRRSGGGPKATSRQHLAARGKAVDAGVTFRPLRSVGQASNMIGELDGTPRMSREERRREDDDVARAMQEEFGGATAFRDDEMDGHGSDAHWT